MLPEIVDGEEEWVVEEILDSKVINWKVRYLVKWEGFGIEHNSWEPWDNVHAPQLIADFYRKHPRAVCHICAFDFNSIPFGSVPRRHSLEGGVDVRGHSVDSDFSVIPSVFSVPSGVTPMIPSSDTDFKYIPPHHRPLVQME